MPEPPSRRASHGEGNIYQKPSGKWACQIMLGRDPATGKPVRRFVSADTRREVRRLRDELVARHRAGMLGSVAVERQTTATFLLRWLEGRQSSIEPSTHTRYGYAINSHLVPLIGRVLIGDLRPDDLRRAYAALTARGLAPRTIRMAHAAIHHALTQAVRDGTLPRNIAEAVEPPKLGRARARALAPEEAMALLDHSTGDWHCLWMLALYTGMRLGELLGLGWKHIDWHAGKDQGTIAVERVLADSDQEVPYLRDYPKSSAGERTIRVPADILDELRIQLNRQAVERAKSSRWVDHDLVFASRFGTFLLRSNVVRTLRRDALAAGIAGNVTPHTLRHTYASSLLAAGRPLPEVAHLLGHSKPTMTLAIYSHFIPDMNDDVTGVLSSFYRRSQR